MAQEEFAEQKQNSPKSQPSEGKRINLYVPLSQHYPQRTPTLSRPPSSLKDHCSPPSLPPPHPCCPPHLPWAHKGFPLFLQVSNTSELPKSLVPLPVNLTRMWASAQSYWTLLLSSQASLQAPHLPTYVLPTACCCPGPSRKEVGNKSRKKDCLLVGPKQGLEAVRREGDTGEKKGFVSESQTPGS